MDVTCLVPAFKVNYLDHLLYCLRTQALPAKRIVLSDDTPSGDFIAAFDTPRIREIATGLPVEVVQGPGQGHHRNIERLLDIFLEAPTSHFHILNDDDIIYPEFYAHHARVCAARDPLCSVSRRWTADDKGHPVATSAIPQQIVASGRSEVGVPPQSLVDSFVLGSRNWLGELSCGIFRADFVDRADGFCVYDGIPYFGLNDIGSFIKASLRGSLIYSNQYLGAFRKSANGLTRLKGYSFSLAILARLPLGIIAFEHRLLDQAKLIALTAAVRNHFAKFYGETIVNARLDAIAAAGRNGGPAGLKAEFLDFWRWYRDDNPEFRALRSQSELAERLRG